MAVVALFGQIGNAHRGDDLRRVVQLQARVRQVARELGMERTPRLPCVTSSTVIRRRTTRSRDRSSSHRCARA